VISRDGEPSKTPEQKIHERKCCQDEQHWPQQTEIEGIIAIRRRYQLKLRRCCRIFVRLRKRSFFGLAREIVELPGRMRGGKPFAGRQDVEVSGRLDTEVPALHGTKNLHSFLCNARVGGFSRRHSLCISWAEL